MADFVSEFLDQSADTLAADRKAVQSQIAQNLQRGQETETAFSALQQSQQPTTFDKIGDIGLGVAGIADLLTGSKRSRGQAGEKFRALKAGRQAEKTAKRDRQAKKFLQQVKLKELTGDIANKNLALALGLSDAERRATKSNLDVILQANRDATSKEQFQKTFELEKKKIDAAIESGKKSAAQTASDSNKEAGKEARKAIGKFDLETERELMEEDGTAGTVTAQQHWLGRISILKAQILKDEFGIELDEDTDIPEDGVPIPGLVQPELLPDIGIRDLIGAPNIPAQSTSTAIPALSFSDLSRLGLSRQR